jgi:hypothetical protein
MERTGPRDVERVKVPKAELACAVLRRAAVDVIREERSPSMPPSLVFVPAVK